MQLEVRCWRLAVVGRFALQCGTRNRWQAFSFSRSLHCGPLTLFFSDHVTTRDLNNAQIYAWRKGVKRLYCIASGRWPWRAPSFVEPAQ